MRSEIKLKSKTFSFEAIGTHWTITYHGSTDIQSKVLECIDKFDTTYSRFRADSWVSRVARQAGSYDMPFDALPLLDFYTKLNEITDGAVNPLVGQTLSDAGYDADYSLRFKRKTIAPSWSDLVTYNEKRIHISEPVLLDFGAAGKGYLVDIICGVLRDHGVVSAVVDAGGDMKHFSLKPNEFIEVGLQHPSEKELAVGTVSVSNQSICGSSINLRAWDNYHHVIDPRTAISPRGIQALWVVSQTAMIADGISTALFFCDAAVLARHFDFEYAVIKQDYSLEHSAGFPGTFFTDRT